MKLPKYALLDIGDRTPLIIMLQPPYFISYAYRVNQKDKDKLDEMDLKMANGDEMVKVPGYSIYLTVAASLKPNDVHGEERKDILREMALFYLASSIEPHKHSERYYCENRGRQYEQL